MSAELSHIDIHFCNPATDEFIGMLFRKMDAAGFEYDLAWECLYGGADPVVANAWAITGVRLRLGAGNPALVEAFNLILTELQEV